jgi:hypothetical protein
MDKQQVLEFSAEFWQVDSSIITDDLRLDDRSLPQNSSIRFYQFIAKIEAHFNARVGNVMDIKTFGDLFGNLCVE